MADSSSENSEEEKKISAIPGIITERQVFVIPSVEELRAEAATDITVTAQELQPIQPKTSKTIRMQRREYERRAKKLAIAQSTDHSLGTILSLDASFFLSESLIKAFQFILVSVYGMYALMALLVLIFYICDHKMALFDYAMVADASSIMTLFLICNVLLSLVGVYSTYRIGASQDRTEALQYVSDCIRHDESECKDVGTFLRNDGNSFLVQSDTFIEGQNNVKYELQKTLHRLHKLGVTLAQFNEKLQNLEIKKIIHWMQMVYQSMYLQNVKLRALQDRSLIIRLFYAKEFKDGKEGLTVKEFDQVRQELDKSGSDKIHEYLTFQFPDFDEFDADGDGMVSLIEFEDKLNETYHSIFENIERKYTQNRKPEDKQYEKELAQSESKQNRSLMGSFKKYVKKTTR